MLQISQYLNLQTFTKGAIFYINISLHISGHLYFKAPFSWLRSFITVASLYDHNCYLCGFHVTHTQTAYIISRLWNPLRAIYITILHYSTTQAWQHVVYNIYIYQWHVLLIFTLQMLHAHCLIYTAFNFELCKPWKKKLMKEKSFVMQKPLINKNENMNFTRFSRMLFVLKKKYDC